MTIIRILRAVGTTATIAAAILAAPAQAQPDSKPESPPTKEPQRRELRREELSKRLQQAKDRIDQGEDPAAVLRDLFPALGRLGPGGGPGRPGDMGDRPPGPDGPDADAGPMGDGPEGGPLAGPRQRRFGPGRAQPNGPIAPGPMSPEQVDRTMAFIKDNMPAMHERLAALREADSIAFERLINRMGPRVHEAAEIKDRDPRLFELRSDELKAGFRVLESVRNYRDALKVKDTKADSVEQARKELREALEAQYQTRLAVQGHEIEGVSKRLEKLRTDLDKSKTERDKRIDGVLKAITEGKEFRDVPFPPPLAPPPEGEGRPRRGGRPNGPPPGPPGEP